MGTKAGIPFTKFLLREGNKMYKRRRELKVRNKRKIVYIYGKHYHKVPLNLIK